jgi:hypothetical protein
MMSSSIIVVHKLTDVLLDDLTDKANLKSDKAFFKGIPPVCGHGKLVPLFQVGCGVE